MKAGGPYIVDPGRLLREMSQRTLGMWLSLAEIDPWDENRGDRRAGEIAAVVAGSVGAKKQDGSWFRADDFMPYTRAQRDPDELEQEEAQRIADSLQSALANASGHQAAADREHLKEP